MSDQTILSAALRPGPDCPDVETLTTCLERSERDPLRLQTERHLESCLHCAAELRLFQEFESGAVRPEESAAVNWIAAQLAKQATPAKAAPAETWWQRWFTPKVLTGFAAVAAAAVLAIGVSMQPARSGRDLGTVPEFRNEVLRTQTMELDELPGKFAWKPVAGAASYEITARTVDQNILFHDFLTTQTLAFPPEVAALVGSGKLVSWEVVARDPSGTEIARSGVQQLKKVPVR